MNSAQNDATNGHVDELREILQAAPTVAMRSKDNEGRSLMHLAVLARSPATVELLASKYPHSVNSRDNVSAHIATIIKERKNI